MTVDGKVTETCFFLEKLVRTGPAGEESVHYLSAFISSSRSIMSELLRDYAKKYGLGFGDDDPLDSRGFRSRAQSKGAQGPVAFVEAYDRAVDRLRGNEYYRVLALRRNISVKRGPRALVRNLTISTQEVMAETGDVRVRVEKDTPIAIGPNVLHPVAPEPEAGSPRDFCFEDFPGESVPQICRLYLNAVLNEVNGIRAHH